VRADVQRAADGLVAPAAAEERQHLALAQRQPVHRRLADPVLGVEQLAEHPRQGGLRLEPSRSERGLDRMADGGLTAALEDQPERTGTDRVDDQLEVQLHGEDQHLDAGPLLEDPLHDRRRPGERHVRVEQ
jgi:hypothetical protein